MSKYLFDDFDAVTPKAWKQKIQVDLNGDDYNDTLLWKTKENITVKPFYTKEDQTHQKINFPSNEFSIGQSIFIHNEEIANKLAIDALEKGATAIEFICNQIFNPTIVLKDINLDSIKVYFKIQFLNADFIHELSQYTNNKKTFFNIDIIGNLAKTGNWFFNLEEDQKIVKKITTTTNNSICVNADLYQNAGATNTQQLAYALAHANEYIELYGATAIDKIHFNFSVNSNYFFEIAKLRAFRILWKTLLQEHNKEDSVAHIFTQPTKRNKTVYDNHVNMIRTTTECMSAVLGGSDTITNNAYDQIFKKSNEFSERIARNQLLIIQQETTIKDAQSIANGSYYIESITNQLAENALEVFKLIEKGGGFLKQLKQGIIQKKITESADKEQKLFDLDKTFLTGVNTNINSKDTMKNNLELFPFVKRRAVKTLIQPIITKRLAEKIEQERLKNE